MRFVRWFLGWVIGSFLFAAFMGSMVWFIASVFGKDMEYFGYIQNWFIAILILDFVLDLIKWGNTNHEWDWDMWRKGDRWS